MTKYRSPLRYPGGKSANTKEIGAQFPKGFREYREPFLGGASMYFYARNHDLAQEYYLSDLYGPVGWFWKQLQNRLAYLEMVSQLYEWLTLDADTKKAIFIAIKKYGIQTASEFYFCNRVSYSGTIESGGFSKSAANGRFTKSSIVRLRQAHEGLNGAAVGIGIHDYDTSFGLPGSGVFIFCDPPYFTAEKLYGKNGDLHKNFSHQRLADRVKRTPHKVLLTYDDCPEIRALYKGFNIIPWDVGYSMGNTKRGAELFIRNY